MLLISLESEATAVRVKLAGTKADDRPAVVAGGFRQCGRQPRVVKGRLTRPLFRIHDEEGVAVASQLFPHQNRELSLNQCGLIRTL
jgi:hypothetical protein